jgi:hypothetical protein
MEGRVGRGREKKEGNLREREYFFKVDGLSPTIANDRMQWAGHHPWCPHVRFDSSRRCASKGIIRISTDITIHSHAVSKVRLRPMGNCLSMHIDRGRASSALQAGDGTS